MLQRTIPILDTFKKYQNKKKVLIYGAGSAGRQLLTILDNNPEMKVVGFLDDNRQFHNQIILGQTVYDPLKIDKLQMHYLALKRQNYTYLGEYSQYTSYFPHMC